MKFRFSKIFYLKTAILLLFLIATLILSFTLGRKFGNYLMGDIQEDETFRAAVEKTEDSEDEYSPLVSSRFKFNPEEFPKDEYKGYVSQRPQEDQVLEDAPRVEMRPAGQSESAESLFDLASDDTEQQSVDEEQKTDNESSTLIHKVHVGTFQNRDSAEKLVILLRQDGYDPYIETIVEDSLSHYRVQIGAFSNEENANILAEELRKKGYNAWTRFTKR